MRAEPVFLPSPTPDAHYLQHHKRTVACLLVSHLSLCCPLCQVGEGKPGFFAISSPPDPNNQGLLEFLIKAQGEAAEAIAALAAGRQHNQQARRTAQPCFACQSSHRPAANSLGTTRPTPTHNIMPYRLPTLYPSPACPPHGAPGGEVSVSPVMGKGFPVEKIPAEGNPTVLMFATGKAKHRRTCYIIRCSRLY